jgi:Zn-dependent protease
VTCASCGAPLGVDLLACPRCHTLRHRERLSELARDAEGAGPSEALAAWREALTLLPPDSRQHAEVERRIRALSTQVAQPPAGGARWGKAAGAAGAAGLVLWKFKTILLLALGKLKFLLLGFGKLGTVLSMFASFGVYAALWGWKFAAGFVLCIYVHEIGHVVALRQFGIPATAPMFIPGFGAFVRLKAYPSTVVEDARVGIAGPVWGAGASAFCVLIGRATESPLMLAIGATSASINLFNLLPILSLDGGRATRALPRLHRGVIGGLALGAGLLLASPFSLFVGIILVGRAVVQSDAPAEGDTVTAAWFAFLVVALSWMAGNLPTL